MLPLTRPCCLRGGWFPTVQHKMYWCLVAPSFKIWCFSTFFVMTTYASSDLIHFVYLMFRSLTRNQWDFRGLPNPPLALTINIYIYQISIYIKWQLWNLVSVLVVGKSCQQNGPAASTSNTVGNPAGLDWSLLCTIPTYPTKREHHKITITFKRWGMVGRYVRSQEGIAFSR